MYWKVIENDQYFGMAELNEDGCLIRANAKLAAILGVAKDELVNVHLVDIVCEENRKEVRARLRAARRYSESWGMHLCMLAVSDIAVWCQTTVIPTKNCNMTQAHSLLIACPLPQLDCTEEVAQLQKDLELAKQQTFDLAMVYANKYLPAPVEVNQIQQNSDSGINQAGDNQADVN